MASDVLLRLKLGFKWSGVDSQTGDSPHNAQLLFYCVLIGLRHRWFMLKWNPLSAMLPFHTERRPSEHQTLLCHEQLTECLMETWKSMRTHRVLCHFAAAESSFITSAVLCYFPIFLQARPFVTCWVWVMHHTGCCQTLPSCPLAHRPALR